MEQKEGSGTYPHRLEGKCRCGVRHGDPLPAPDAGRNGRKKKPQGEPTAVWHIKDAGGETWAVHVRFDHGPEDKDCLWRLPGAGPRDWGLKGLNLVELPLYRSEQVKEWPEDTPAIVVEGEKAADALAEIYPAVLASVTGASGTPGIQALEVLRERSVILWSDNDDEGRRHMVRIAERLQRVAAEIRVFEWKDAPPKGDAADHPAVLSRSREGIGAILKSMAASPIYSSATSSLGADERKPVFKTAKEVAGETPARIDWLSRPWTAKGAITEIDGKIKAAGKTTFVLSMVGSTVAGHSFLGEPTQRAKVLYLTEQSPTTFRRALERAGLTECEDLHVLFWHDVAGWAWADVARLAADKALDVGAGLLVVDTLGQFAGIRGDSENNAGAAHEAMKPLQEAAARGLAVVITRHERKGGGEVGDSARGSSAFGGAVDIIIALRRAEGNTRPTVRVIESLSRFDETPDKIVVELTEDGYRSLGNATAFAEKEARAAITELLPSKAENATATTDVVDKLGKLGIKRTVGIKALSDLVEAGIISRTGAGKRGNPYRYYKDAAAPDEIDSFVPRDGVPNETKEDRAPEEQNHSSETPAGSERNESGDEADQTLSFATSAYTRAKENGEDQGVDF